MRNWGIAGIVALAVALVIVPVALDRTQGMRARWALARVANSVDLNSGDPERELAEAIRDLPAPEKEADYWLVRLKLALRNDDSEEVLRVLRRSMAELGGAPYLAGIAFRHYDSKREFDKALQVRLLTYSPPDRTSVFVLNEIAYLRSLAVVDLDQGLEEINLALERFPEVAAFRDTRAWILFQMGRLQEALADADFAVKQGENDYQQTISQPSFRIVEWLYGKARPAAEDGLLTEREAGQALWTLGTLHYHRGKILEALGRTDEADQEWKWLADRQLPKDERLR
ncbi:MAG: hypothetical protein KF752_07395 [Pirellulaceae bacterium]|nr:hypothetical protein [Pirellulaceae bacterium]